MTKVPPPGSLAAKQRGCTCSMVENGGGRGIHGGAVRHPNSGLPIYSISFDCPLHGEAVGFEWEAGERPT